MDSLLDWLNNNPWLNLVSLALGALGIILAVVFFLRSTRTRKPYYTSSSFPLIRSHLTQIPGLSIEHEGRPVSSLVVTDLAFWNQGREVIDRRDVAPKDPLVIRCDPSITVFSIGINSSSGSPNDFIIQETDLNYEWRLTFDYMAYRDGASIRIMHSEGGKHPFTVGGTVKGAGAVKFIHPEGYMGIFEDAMSKRYDPIFERFEPKRQSGPTYWVYWTMMFFVVALPYMIASLPLGFANLARRPAIRPPQFGSGNQQSAT